jgi:hypothetical protein
VNTTKTGSACIFPDGPLVLAVVAALLGASCAPRPGSYDVVAVTECETEATQIARGGRGAEGEGPVTGD